ncbi:MAG: sigma factor [Shinella sp.]|uniref:sigma factor n=1 Tax=Shinella sp. TaxID=1870904 RepID=UPI0040365F35
MHSDDIAGLVNRIAIGDRAAFVSLYESTSPKRMGICLRILSNRGDAEEALHEIYIKVWQRARTFSVCPSSTSA